MKYMVSSPIITLYYVYSDIDSFFLYTNVCLEEEMSHMESQSQKIEDVKLKNETEDDKDEGLWHMDFDGAVSKEGAGVGVWILDTNSSKSKTYSYNLNFQCTNNVAKYEALILGLQLLKRSGTKRISIHGDSELIINRIKGEYSAKYPRLRANRIAVIDFLRVFHSINCLSFLEVKMCLLMHWLPQQVHVKFLST